jgi:uncharacterized protein (UPF0335 family)
MATEAKETKPGTSNGYDPAVVKGFVGRIEECNQEKMREHMAYMGKCKEINEDISDILDEAKAKGIPKRALRLNVKRRQLESKIDDIREDLEDDEQDDYDLLMHALGDLADTDLGKSALARRAERAKTETAVDDLAKGAGATTKPRDIPPARH